MPVTEKQQTPHFLGFLLGQILPTLQAIGHNAALVLARSHRTQLVL